MSTKVAVTDTASVVWVERRGEPWGGYGWVLRFVRDGERVEKDLPAMDRERPEQAVQDARGVLIREGILLPDHYLAGLSHRAPAYGRTALLHAADPTQPGFSRRAVCGMPLRSQDAGKFNPEADRACRVCKRKVRHRARKGTAR